MIASVLLQVMQREWPASAIHDSVAAAARGAAFRRSLQESLGERLIQWLADGIAALSRAVRDAPGARPVGYVIVGLIVVLVVARLLIAARARDDVTTPRRLQRRGRDAADPVLEADRLAAEGRFEEAAHALYRGVLVALARSERLRLDASKTSGDYARELRAKRSGHHQPFRAFARRFDAAVYGYDRCDAGLIADLRRLAQPFLAQARAA